MANKVLTATACPAVIPKDPVEWHKNRCGVPPLHPIRLLFFGVWAPLNGFGSVCIFQGNSGVRNMTYGFVRSLWDLALADLPIVVLGLLIHQENGPFFAFHLGWHGVKP